MLSTAPVPAPYVPARFDVDDPAAYEYLNQHGYTVLKDVLTPAQLEQGRDLAWDFLESLPHAGIKRNVPDTWSDGDHLITPCTLCIRDNSRNGWPDPFGTGILVSDGVGQSPFLWFNRGLDTVQSTFANVWQTDELATSFDGFCIFRPVEYSKDWATAPGKWFHVDQDGVTKPDKMCVQGLVNYYDSGETDGGLVVVPGSHKLFKQMFIKRPWLGNRGDFVPLEDFGSDGPWQNEIREAGLKPVKLCIQAGDMVLWDSRTIHCNASASTLRPLPADGSLLPPRRLVAYVCMVPLSRLSEDVKTMRRKGFFQGFSTTHWPDKVQFSGGIPDVARKHWKPPQLTSRMRSLVPLDPNDDGDGASVTEV